MSWDHEDEFDEGFEEGKEPEEIAFEELKVTTDLARLFVIDGVEVWIPKSVCEDVTMRDKDIFDKSGTVCVERWFLEQEGII